MAFVRLHKRVHFWRRHSAGAADLQTRINAAANRNSELVGDTCLLWSMA